eukprot:Pgem_evm2s3474
MVFTYITPGLLVNGKSIEEYQTLLTNYQIYITLTSSLKAENENVILLWIDPGLYQQKFSGIVFSCMVGLVLPAHMIYYSIHCHPDNLYADYYINIRDDIMLRILNTVMFSFVFQLAIIMYTWDIFLISFKITTASVSNVTIPIKN